MRLECGRCREAFDNTKDYGNHCLEHERQEKAMTEPTQEGKVTDSELDDAITLANAWMDREIRGIMWNSDIEKILKAFLKLADERSMLMAPREDKNVCWFVERWNIPGNHGEGWFNEPKPGFENRPGIEGCGGVGRDPLKATRYTESEARAVVKALNHFNAFTDRNFEWKATEHEFMSELSSPQEPRDTKKEEGK